MGRGCRSPSGSPFIIYFASLHKGNPEIKRWLHVVLSQIWMSPNFIFNTTDFFLCSFKKIRLPIVVCSMSRCLGEGGGAVEHVLVVGSRNRMKPAPVLVFLAVLAQIDIGVHSPNTEPRRTVWTPV
jgi:hypothetical protein